MKTLLLVLMAFLVTACELLPTKIDTVYVPVYTPCVTHRPQKPELKFNSEQGDIYYQVKALLYDRVESMKYELDLEAVIEGCTLAP